MSSRFLGGLSLFSKDLIDEYGLNVTCKRTRQLYSDARKQPLNTENTTKNPKSVHQLS